MPFFPSLALRRDAAVYPVAPGLYVVPDAYAGDYAFFAGRVCRPLLVGPAPVVPAVAAEPA